MAVAINDVLGGGYSGFLLGRRVQQEHGLGVVLSCLGALSLWCVCGELSLWHRDLMASAAALCRTASHWAFVNKHFRTSLSHLLLISVY